MKRMAHALLMSLYLLILPASLLAAPADGSSTAPTDPVLGAEGKVSVWTYSKAFAKRFNLPEMEEEGLPPDIQAMELRLVWRDLGNDSSFYDCELHAYVNNQLKIFYPEGDVGSIETLRMGEPAHPTKMSNMEDRDYFHEKSSAYGLKAVFSSVSKRNSLGGGIDYLYYRKYLLSDLAYLTFTLHGCSAFGAPDEYKYSLWIEKEGGRDYRHWTKLDPAEFFQFEIPKPLVQRFYPHAKKAEEKSGDRIDAENKARLDKLQQTQSDQPRGEAIQKEINMMTSDLLEQRGKQLRAAIEQTYKKLSDAKALKPMGASDITEVVVQYIPVGTSFDDAESILRNAGFKVDPRPSANPTGSRPDRYDVVGSIVPFVQLFLSRVNVYISLSPMTPGDYSKVSKVSAGMTLSTL
ncbi:MAG: hypothetical protein FD165_2321 [Gammaproteobacteria bacterium]|nr:MAG: hypothetical protein FD165_2321 [Gammaproteobacteria bacterium]TND01460.1 MAG: hypothetical protein FD120_2633 [Gammaproteobacteria bacterium]